MKKLTFIFIAIFVGLCSSCTNKSVSTETVQTAESTSHDSVILVRVLPPYAEIASNIVDKGVLKADLDTLLSFSVQNIDKFPIEIDSIQVSMPDAKPWASRNSIKNDMIIAVGAEMRTPKEKGPFSCKLKIFAKGVAKSSDFEIVGVIE